MVLIIVESTMSVDFTASYASLMVAGVAHPSAQSRVCAFSSGVVTELSVLVCDVGLISPSVGVRSLALSMFVHVTAGWMNAAGGGISSLRGMGSAVSVLSVYEG